MKHRYSITSSARISIDCGTVRPSALAVLRFTRRETMVITMPESLVTLFEVAMAAEGLGFECVGEGSLTSEYIVNAPIEQIRETIAKAAAESIEVTIPDDAKA